MVSLKKIGVLGGTFDPPHLGHLKLATHFAKLFQLDALLLIPSGKKKMSLPRQVFVCV